LHRSSPPAPRRFGRLNNPITRSAWVKKFAEIPQMPQAFFDKVTAPIVNKMFECGMTP
jgi:acyl carrier protein phosphodiesterase